MKKKLIKPVKKDASFWDDEDDVAPVAQQAPIAAPASAPPVETLTEEEECVKTCGRHYAAQVPPGFYALTCGSTRIIIVDKLGSDWKDLLCFNLQLRCMQHLKREDINPKDAVLAACEFLRKVMN